jgi:putative FmdB family regulatory protein
LEKFVPDYHYQCPCGHEFEIRQSIKEPRLKTCPECEKDTLETVIYGGILVSVDPGITTLGKQAEVNTKKMGSYARSELEEKNPKPDGKVAYTNRELRKKIEKMTPKQKERYIIEGR